MDFSCFHILDNNLNNLSCRAEISVGQETKDKITSVVETLDTLACSGLASLTDMVPGLKKPELLEDVKVGLLCNSLSPLSSY